MTDEQQRPDDPNRDLGLGSRVAQQSRLRFLNRDGTFNVKRNGLSFFQSLSLYHWLLTMSWTAFFALIIIAYLLVNVVFAFGYELCGPDALEGIMSESVEEHWLASFFFSVQTSATIGYGRISPKGLGANTLVTIEALVGLLGFALATGLLFARFSRPNAKVIFSKHGLIAPYGEITAFMFRLVNQRSSQLIEAEMTVAMSRFEDVNGVPTRRFYPLKLERNRVSFFPLHWVVVHPIDEKSPLFRVTRDQFEQSEPEFLVLLTAVEETFSQTVHTRCSYKGGEIIWGARFSDMYVPDADGRMAIDVAKVHSIEKVQLSN